MALTTLASANALPYETEDQRRMSIEHLEEAEVDLSNSH
jgi:hypothetical protein